MAYFCYSGKAFQWCGHKWLKCVGAVELPKCYQLEHCSICQRGGFENKTQDKTSLYGEQHPLAILAFSTLDPPLLHIKAKLPWAVPRGIRTQWSHCYRTIPARVWGVFSRWLWLVDVPPCAWWEILWNGTVVWSSSSPDSLLLSFQIFVILRAWNWFFRSQPPKDKPDLPSQERPLVRLWFTSLDLEFQGCPYSGQSLIGLFLICCHDFL